tara:strand:- start:428 stop:637 length:210 start_codon:yes stop_codon:yes gene_type:complete
MRESFIKTTSAALIYVIMLPALPHFLSILSSSVVIIYFLSMLKFNIVDKKYKGSWKLFLKAWFKARKDK